MHMFSPEAWEDYLWFQEHDRKLLKKVNELLRDIGRTPTSGIGKPERLKGNYQGCWSRRISEEHRLIYQILDQGVLILRCRSHYAN